MIEIIQNGNKILRKISKEIPIDSIKKDKCQRLIRDMKEALHSQDDGVAIAAPQIGISLRVFVVSGRVFDDNLNRSRLIKENEVLNPKNKIHDDIVFINPKFLTISKDRKSLSEGCLSVRPLYGKVKRATRASVEAYNEKGEKFIKKGTGLLAQIFQHEIDHLDGVLFIDKARNLHEATSAEEYSNAKR